MSKSLYKPNVKPTRSRKAIRLSVAALFFITCAFPLRRLLILSTSAGNLNFFGTIFQDIAGLIPTIVAIILSVLAIKTLKDRSVEHVLSELSVILISFTIIASTLYCITAFTGIIALIFLIPNLLINNF